MENYNENIDYLQLLKNLFGEDYTVMQSVVSTERGKKIRIEICEKLQTSLSIGPRIHIGEYNEWDEDDLPFKTGVTNNINEFAHHLLSLYVRSAFLVSTTAVVMNLLEKQDNSTEHDQKS